MSQEGSSKAVSQTGKLRLRIFIHLPTAARAAPHPAFRPVSALPRRPHGGPAASEAFTPLQTGKLGACEVSRPPDFSQEAEGENDRVW